LPPPPPDPDNPLDPTFLLLGWLEGDPNSLTAARSHGAVEGRIAAYTSDDSAGGDAVTAGELDELRAYLEKRVSSDSDLAALRRDLAKFAAVHGPRDVADLSGMVTWALTQIDWMTVKDIVITTETAA
jgi:hypothetical protein